MTETLTLKWGTVKAWSDLSDKSFELMKTYYADGVPMSAAMDKPNAARKDILCNLIDQLEGEIWSDWNGVVLSKDEAKKYIREYGAQT